ncbi:MAG: peptide chain release factor-like protein [Planctomycetota bacterium]
MLTPPTGKAPAFVDRPHPATLRGDELLAQCELGRGRGGGPGGQHRNKVSTLVMLTHRETGVHAQAGERRSARDNQRVAIDRLRHSLATYVRTYVPIGDARSDLWRSRVPKQQIVVSPRHADFPSMLAEALDVIWAADLDHSTAALRLVCTPTQLVRLLKDYPPALGALNEARIVRGMPRLK